MIRHLFLMIWNQKRRNVGLILEIFFSFLVLFAVLTFIIYNYDHYRQPLGFAYDNVWAVQLGSNGTGEEQKAVHQEIKNLLTTFPEIERFSFSSENIPFGYSMNMTSLKKGQQELHANIFTADAAFPEVMTIPLVEGRWFSRQDDASKNTPIVINAALKKELFGSEPAIGKLLDRDENTKHEVIGVIDNYRYQGDFSPAEPGFFEKPDSFFLGGVILLKMRPTADAAFEAKFLRSLSQLASDWTFEIKYMDEMRVERLKSTIIPIAIFLIISCFLVFNVALGLFGVLYYNINKRKEEIGVRRAMGSTKGLISQQFIGEVLVIATFSLVLGIFFAIQIPLLDVFPVKTEVYLIAIITAILLIYSLVFFCSFYPSRQAATLQPAMALHEE